MNDICFMVLAFEGYKLQSILRVVILFALRSLISLLCALNSVMNTSCYIVLPSLLIVTSINISIFIFQILKYRKEVNNNNKKEEEENF